MDNVAYEVNGELIVRVSKEANLDRQSESTRREADLLVVVTGLSSLPVPELVFADIESGALAYFKLLRVPLADHPVAESEWLATALGEFLDRLHRTPVEQMVTLVGRDTDPLTTWWQETGRDYREIPGLLPPAARHLVEDFLGRTPSGKQQVVAFCHNDLGAEHALVDAGANTVTGVIDWTDAAIADPGYDLAPIYRDLGPEVFDLTRAHYEGRFDEADRERTVFYARYSLLEDITYGLNTPGACRYSKAPTTLVSYAAPRDTDLRLTVWAKWPSFYS